ncbi:AAA family ATPase [Variovorax dokdonensis]|uniref:AAA family ATPase n=1 Tax=Variovorax dokdonensis TaxID=344883 RepID=A0ABT7NE80_9BURK|nr:AAA family ATPase [Variovorax dokdonensis]MDM0046261.1 AAA family ATPase [Variovorax dokdonensis]
MAGPHGETEAASAGPERRQLTVLFCDLVGSTALSHHLDPEDVRDIILRYQRTARSLIERYEGDIARYMGDGILAYFGYPTAHEDDPARAVLAGLDIVAAPYTADASLPSGARLEVRVGIATGLVVVGDRIGAGASQEAAAVGESINLAARLQSLAPSGCLVISDRTRELTQGRFEFRDHGLHDIKGFDEPVRAWQVVRGAVAESRFHALRDRGMTPFIGREEEVARGQALLRRVEDGAGQVLLLLGEAGIGKSRLAETLLDGSKQRAARIVRLQCSPYHPHSALHPLIQRLRHEAGLDGCEAPGQAHDRLCQLLASASADEPEPGDLARRVAVLAALLSLPEDPRYPPPQLTAQQLKARTLEVAADWLLAPSGSGPCLVLVEDAHWIDPTSLQLLDLLVRRAADAPAGIVITSRTTLDVPWVALGHVNVILLDRLGADEAGAMACSLLADEAPSAKLVAQIVRLTDGVPLFIEEFTKAVESRMPVQSNAGGERLSNLGSMPDNGAFGVPLTLQDSLMARLDRLGSAKQVAQMAAVLGREFTRDGLAGLCGLDHEALDAALGVLMESQVVFGRGSPPHPAFAFKHALVQEAAYASLLRHRRQELHGRAGTILANVQPGGAAVEPELVAHHYALAGQALAAARYSALAGKRSLDRWANLEALGHTALGLEQLEHVQEGEARDQVELALRMIEGTAHRAVHGFASAHVMESFARALVLCERLGDAQHVVDVRRGLFSFYYARGELDLARHQGEQVMQLAEHHPGDRDTRVLAEWMLGVMAFWRGEFGDACERLERAASLYSPHADGATTLALQIDPAVNAWSHLTWGLWILGRPGSALACGARAVATARTLNQPLALAMAQFFHCATLACCGRYDALDEPLGELLAVTSEHGLVYLGSCAKVLRGQHWIETDHHAEGLAQVELAWHEFQAQQAQLGLPWLLSIMALGHAGVGRTAQAMEAIEAALQAMERKGERQWAPEVWRIKAKVLLMGGPDRVAEARAALQTSFSMALAQKAGSLALRSATSLAALLARQGEGAAASAILLPVRAQITEGEGTADLRAADELMSALR